MIKKYITMINLYLRPDGNKKAKYLKKNKIFYRMGDNCYYHPRIIPTEPWLVSIGNNVVITANVSFITHDILAHTFSYLDDKAKYKTHFGSIKIEDNVFIGANSTIMYNTIIGSNVIIAAGSVVHGHIPSGVVVAGNPARVIGKFEDVMMKRRSSNIPSAKDGKNKIMKYFWSDEYDK